MNIFTGFCIFLAVYSIVITGLYIWVCRELRDVPKLEEERGHSGICFPFWG